MSPWLLWRWSAESKQVSRREQERLQKGTHRRWSYACLVDRGRVSGPESQEVELIEDESGGLYVETIREFRSLE